MSKTLFSNKNIKQSLKQFSPDAQKIKMKKILKLTVNTGHVIFSGEIYYY